MRKLFGAACVILIALGAAWYILADGASSFNAAKKEVVEKAQDAILNNATPEDVAALAMKAINMSQGERGMELWRLKADWGNVRRKDNVMELEKPRFTYYMPPDNKAISILSDKGDVDEEQRIRFLDSVVATYEDKTLFAPEMHYVGKTREVICPRGGRVVGEGYEGTADEIVWHMNEHRIMASGNIDVTFESDADIFKSRQEPGDTRPAGETPGTETTQG